MSSLRSAAFIGNMNAMPMTYALHLREWGWDVTYYVDTPVGDKLSRPELKFPSIQYPYPDWIIERPLRSQLLAVLGPRWLLSDIIRTLRRADVVFLSGLFLALARFLGPKQQVFFLSHGSDLDLWCDRESVGRLGELFAGRVGRYLSGVLVRAAVHRMAGSLRRLSAAVTFPAGLSASADRVLARELAGSKVERLARYDISFADLPELDQIRTEPPADVLRIVCGTRHTFRDHPGLTDKENKGTDVIIRALAQYSRLQRKSVEVHLFEKGLDLAEAKQLCAAVGLAPHVIWHAEMPFQEFLQLHQRCHIAFDQVGSHWVGAGMYAMYLSLPVIANSREEALKDFWGEPSPICHAQDEASIVQWLIRLEDGELRATIGARSQRFALKHFDSAVTTRRVLELIESLGQQSWEALDAARAGATSLPMDSL